MGAEDNPESDNYPDFAGSVKKKLTPQLETSKKEAEAEEKVEEIKLDNSKLERKVITAIGTVPCYGSFYKGSGILSKAREETLALLGNPVYPLKIVYDYGEVEVFCHYIWEKYCLVPPDKNINTLCAYFSSRKIHSKALK